MIWHYIKDYWHDAVEILVLAGCIYQIYRAFRETKGAQILAGLIMLIVLLTLFSIVFKFVVIQWILTRLVTILALALIIIFQPELRISLARLGSHRLLYLFNRSKSDFFEIFVGSVVALAKKRYGAIFAFQKDVLLKEQIETGVKIDASYSSELAQTIFFPKNPLHDGGVVIIDERITAAACVFPVSEREFQDRSIGLRHRAAIGLAERSDALVVVVSEETGGISIAINGKILRNLTEAEFRDAFAKAYFSLKIKDERETNKTDKPLGAETGVAAASDSDLVSD